MERQAGSKWRGRLIPMERQAEQTAPMESQAEQLVQWRGRLSNWSNGEAGWVQMERQAESEWRGRLSPMETATGPMETATGPMERQAGSNGEAG